MSLSNNPISSSCLSSLASSGFSITPIDTPNAERLTKKDLEKIYQLHFLHLTPGAFQAFAGKIKQLATEDNIAFALQHTTAFEMGEALEFVINSARWPGLSNYAVTQTPNRQMSAICIFCNESVQNYCHYNIQNTAKKTSLRVSALIVHHLKNHGFCGMDAQRIEPETLLDVVDKPKQPSRAEFFD